MPLSQHRAARRDRGISSVEYALAVAGVASLLSIAVMGLGGQLAAVFQCMAAQLNGPVLTCGGLDSPGGATGGDGTTQAGDPGAGDPGGDRSAGGNSGDGGSGDGSAISGTPTTDPTGTPSASASPSPTPTESPSSPTPTPPELTPATPTGD